MSDRSLKYLELGKIYTVAWLGWGYKMKMECKFIQPTRCGFNFLNLKTNKCILKQHLYPSKKHTPNKYFWVNNNLIIDMNKKEIKKRN